MKRFMLAALTVAMVAINPAASADSGSNGGGRGGGGGSYHGGGGNHGGNGGGGSYHGGGNRGGGGSYHGGGGNPGGGSYHGGGGNQGGGSYHGGGGKYYGGYYGPPPKSAYPSQKAYRQARFNYPPYPAPYYRPPYYKGYYPYPRPYYGRPYYPVGYPAYYGYPYYYGNHHNNNNNSDWPAYLIGGAVLGSVLTNVYQSSQVQQVPAQQVVVAPQQGRRLLRDLNGNCYDRSTDANGNELRTELPPSACNW